MTEIREHRNSLRWYNLKKEWHQINLPDEDGNYVCALCGGIIEPNLAKDDPMRFSLDHIIEASEDITLFFALSNLQATHHQCNLNKTIHAKLGDSIDPETVKKMKTLAES